MEFSEEIEISEDLVRRFSDISGDKNPVHLDADYCSKYTTFKRPIAHGLLISSFFSKIIAEVYPGPGSVYLSQNINFIKPCYVGETIRVSVSLERIEKHKYYLSTRIFNSLNMDLLVDGSALVLKKIKS